LKVPRGFRVVSVPTFHEYCSLFYPGEEQFDICETYITDTVSSYAFGCTH